MCGFDSKLIDICRFSPMYLTSHLAFCASRSKTPRLLVARAPCALTKHGFKLQSCEIINATSVFVFFSNFCIIDNN